MILFPAIDLFGGKAVRLFKGDYNEMTVYDPNPIDTALKFKAAGATHMHIVDLEGAKTGGNPNFDTICKLVQESGLFTEVGGGIRSLDIAKKYLDAGVNRVIFGTAAATDPDFCREAAKSLGEHAAVGVDVRDGMVAIRGWTEKSAYGFEEFCDRMQDAGISTLICTDISRDGAMKGTNLAMYRTLSEKYSMNIIASGGVSSIEDVRALNDMNVYGAIIGKAYYTGAIDLTEALKIARGDVK